MSKKEKKAETTVSAGMTPELQKILDSLPEDGQKYMNGLEESKRIEHLSLMLELNGSGQETAKNSVNVQEVSLKEDDSDDVNLIFGKSIFQGMTLDLEFMGSVHLMSSDFKENWNEVLIGGETFYESRKFRFREPKTGKIIHIFNCPMMANVLRSLPTKSSPLTASRVHKDPRVLISYDGKVTREEALEKYGFVFKTGTHTHAVRIKILDEGFPVDRYSKGVINWVEKPYNVRKAYEGDAIEFETSRWDEATRVVQNDSATTTATMQ